MLCVNEGIFPGTNAAENTLTKSRRKKKEYLDLMHPSKTAGRNKNTHIDLDPSFVKEFNTIPVYILCKLV